MPPLPSPAVSNGEPPAVAVLLNEILSAATGTPGDAQFCASDQFVFTVAASTPIQVTEGRTPIGPAVSVSRRVVPSPPLVPIVPVKAGTPVGRVPSTKLYPLIPLGETIKAFVAG